MRHLVFFIIAGWVLFLLWGCAEDSPFEVPSQQSTIIHVSLDGADWFPGTAEKPVSTVGRGFALALEAGAKEIRIATGTYNAHIHLVGGIDLIGGLNPSTWEEVPGERSVLKYSGNSTTGQDIQIPTLIRSLEFQCDRNFGNIQPAVSLFGCGPDLHFSHCAFVTASGRDGDPGYSPEDRPPMPDSSFGANGSPGSCSESIEAPGGQAVIWTYCRGGDGGLPGQPGSAGHNGDTNSEYPGFGLGGIASLPGMPGEDGQDGYDGTDGIHSSTLTPRFFLLGTEVVLPHPISSGENSGNSGGGAGGGSGGGGSMDGTGNGGGAGGLGGNGGRNGSGGDCGDHSIAMLCQNSTVRFSNCLFQPGGGGNGGDGGDGACGSAGQAGGMGGTYCSPEVGAGGNGGHGGDGGQGGAGAGGNGGDSVGVIILGSTEPVIDDDCTFQLGPAGVGGQGGLHGNESSNAPAGLNGRAANTLNGNDSS